MHCSCQQCLVAEWLGLRVRARTREWDFSFLLFFFVCVKIVVLHVNGSYNVHGIRTTPVRDVMMMYCKERYMENVPPTPRNSITTMV